MAPSIKKYLLYTIFLVSPLSLSLHAQSKIEKPVNSIVAAGMTMLNLNQITAITPVINLDNSKQFMVELSIPKDSFAIATDANNQQTSECKENTSITATYSVLAKDIIENYKYDFSETFIDILFSENIDLARTRTI